MQQAGQRGPPARALSSGCAEASFVPLGVQLQAEEAQDEFSAHFSRAVAPKVLLTTCRRPSKGLLRFVAELLGLLPGAHFYKRGDYAVKQMVQYATARGFTALLVLHENRKRPNGLLCVSLPAGPTAHFRLSSLKLRADIPGAGRPTRHTPELILNNFSTRLGLRVGRYAAPAPPCRPPGGAESPRGIDPRHADARCRAGGPQSR